MDSKAANTLPPAPPQLQQPRGGCHSIQSAAASVSAASRKLIDGHVCLPAFLLIFNELCVRVCVYVFVSLRGVLEIEILKYIKWD